MRVGTQEQEEFISVDHGKKFMNLPQIQEYLKEQHLDGWLLFDFRNQNPIANNLLNQDAHALLTRRWFFFVPQHGAPSLLVHRIERNNFPRPPSRVLDYVGWREMRKNLMEMLANSKEIAMEYSPQAAIPYVSYVDGGTLELVRSLGVKVASSANLVQYFLSRWSNEQLESHKRASAKVYEIKDQAFALIRDKIQSKAKVTERDVQLFIISRFEEEGMTTHEPPIVAVNQNASNPHYAPSEEVSTSINHGDLVLIDLFSKEDKQNAIYADITWMGYVGATVPEKPAAVFSVVAAARDAGLQQIEDAFGRQETIQGYEVDERVRRIISENGYGPYFIHRTGHSLDVDLHGSGVNLDSLETQDEREIIPGLGFTIEPGIYLPEFGVRSEINVYYSQNGPEVFGPIQSEIINLMV